MPLPRLEPEAQFELLIEVISSSSRISMNLSCSTNSKIFLKNAENPDFFVGHNEGSIRDQNRYLEFSYKNRNTP